MNIKTILLVIAIVILLYLIARREKMENINNNLNDDCRWNDGDVVYNPENRDCKCSWTDSAGIVYNQDMQPCLMCYECRNLETSDITIRSNCIKAGPNKEEQIKLVGVHDNRSSCNL